MLVVSAAFFYAPEDDVALLILHYSKPSEAERLAVGKLLSLDVTGH